MEELPGVIRGLVPLAVRADAITRSDYVRRFANFLQSQESSAVQVWEDKRSCRQLPLVFGEMRCLVSEDTGDCLKLPTV